MSQRICEVDGCEKGAHARRMCPRHYRRWRENGDPGPAGLLKRASGAGHISADGYRVISVAPEVECSIEGCASGTVARGYCRRHYSRWYRTGDPGGADVLRAVDGTGYIDARGYRRRGGSKGRRTIFEHRHVMEQAIGRPLHPWEVVHHKNGDRLDNRLDNLELCVKRSHVPGQRVADLVAFVAEHYRAEIEAALA